jgi:hypothetical protein
MKLKKQLHAVFSCGMALAIGGFSAHAAEPDAAPSATPSATAAADAPDASVTLSLPPVAPAAQEAAAPQTRLRFSRGGYKPGIERLRVVRREDTGSQIAGQLALNVATTLIAGRLSIGGQGFSKDDLGGATLEELKDDPLAVNPAIAELNDALSKVAQAQQRIGERRGHAGQRAQLLHHRHQRVEFHRLAGFHVLQHRGLEGAELARDLVPVFGLLRDRDADAAADFRASSITAEMKPRTRSSFRIRSVVAPVIALTGLTVMLPHSLYQASFWICSTVRVDAGALAAALASSCTRSVFWPEGSPMISLLPK